MNEVQLGFFLWTGLQVVIGYNLILPVLLSCLYFLKHGGTQPDKRTSASEADYAIIVTAYLQTDFLVSVIKSILSLNYTNYLVYVVADNCDTSNLKFDDHRVLLLKPEQALASNTKSHFYAIEHFKRPHERLTIIDSDNLVHPEYLNEFNKYFDEGFIAMQGVRKAKNLNTTLACLDAARDIYYHFYDGKVLFHVGASATLAGSGMAFTTSLYKQCFQDSSVSGAGFDKMLQFQIVKRGLRISFVEGAIVFDEKTSKSDQLVQQRARWINTWFKYFSLGFKLLKMGVYSLNWNKFLFGLILLRPPLFITILLSSFCLLINFLYDRTSAFLWVISLSLFLVGFFVSLLQQRTDRRIYTSLLGVPKFIFLQIVSLVYVKSANAKSVSTTHYQHEDLVVLKDRK